MVCAMRFEWDPDKDRSNRAKHGVAFEEAKQLLGSDLDYLEIYDEEHSSVEDRFIAIGPADRGLIVVSFTEREPQLIRIISARLATDAEAKLLERYWRGKR